MNAESIYQYSSARKFILDFAESKQRTDAQFSVRRWARDMGLKNHTLLIFLLQGKRPLRLKHSTFLAAGMGLSSHERLYFQALIQWESAKTEQEKTLCQLLLSDLHPGGAYRLREVDEFSVIAQWYHMSILSMAELKNHKLTPENAHALLSKHALSIHEIRAAFERLASLGLLKQNEMGEWTRTPERVTTRDDVANAGAREYHKQVAQLAARALDENRLNDREFQSLSLSISSEKIPLVKEMIRKFREQLCRAVAGPGDHVYQMNLHFFRMTESPSDQALLDQKETKNSGYSQKTPERTH